MGRILIVAMLALAVGLGAFMYYLQVYAYYDAVEGDGQNVVVTTPNGPATLEITEFRGIDSISSPLRYRACFTLRGALPDAALAPAMAEPRVAPRWFDCFDATQIGADLAVGAAQAYLGVENLQYGIDRVIAIYPDGRGFVWHQINACGEAVFNRNPAPDTCPPPPES